MKLFYLLAASFLLSSPAWADQNPELLLNKVILQLRSEQWVTTKTALVNVNVNAAVNNQGIEKIQTDIMQKLSQLSSQGDWHIVSFDRQLDKSGLENVQIIAQARLAQTELSGLRDKAKNLSKPGTTFTIENIQFTPTEDEIRLANINLRNNIYQQAKTELDTINKLFTNQKYYLHQISFLPYAMPMAQNTFVAKAEAMATPLSVGNKQELQATVILAANAEQNNQNGAHN